MYYKAGPLGSSALMSFLVDLCYPLLKVQILVNVWTQTSHWRNAIL